MCQPSEAGFSRLPCKISLRFLHRRPTTLHPGAGDRTPSATSAEVTVKTSGVNTHSVLLCQKSLADPTDFNSVGRILLYWCFPFFSSRLPRRSLSSEFSQEPPRCLLLSALSPASLLSELLQPRRAAPAHSLSHTRAGGHPF